MVTELFFTRPVELREEIPDLYEVLAAFFRQDPAALVPVPPPAPPQRHGQPGANLERDESCRLVHPVQRSDDLAIERVLVGGRTRVVG